MGTDDAPIAYPFPGPVSLFHPAPPFARLRAEDPVARVVTPDGNTAFLVTRWADVRQVMLDPRFSRDMRNRTDVPVAGLARTATGSMVAMDPPEHTRMRRLVTSAFTGRRVEALRPDVTKLVDQLLGDMTLGPSPADLVEHLSVALPLRVISALLGVPREDQHVLHEWSDVVMGDWEQSRADLDAALGQLGGYFAELVARKRAEPADDLVTALIAARDEQDRLSERELVGMCVGMLVAGHATTVSALSMSVLTLLHEPEQLAALREDPSGVPAAVEELLRFVQMSAGGGGLPRVALEDVEISGHIVPAGSLVMQATNAANRDPDRFADPDRLDLGRTGNKHITFGVGVHHCLGASLVRMEMQEALLGLFRHAPCLRLAVPEDELAFRQGMFVRTIEALPVTW